MIHTIDTSEFDDIISELYQRIEKAEQLENHYDKILAKWDSDLQRIEQDEARIAEFEGEPIQEDYESPQLAEFNIENITVHQMNVNFNIFEDLISDYNERMSDIKNDIQNIHEAEIALKRLSVMIIKWERHLIQLQMKYVASSMNQKHEITKHLIKETYKTKMKEMKNEITNKTENLKKMLQSVDDILQNWKEIQKETEIELEEKTNHINVYKNEIKLIDMQINIEEAKIKELKDALDQKKEINSSDFKQKLDEIDQLEAKKKDLKEYNTRMLDNIEDLENKKEELENELNEYCSKILNNVKLKKQLKDKELNERRKQFEIKDQLYEKKRHVESLHDDVSTKVKEVQQLKKLLTKLSQNMDGDEDKSQTEEFYIEQFIDDDMDQSELVDDNNQRIQNEIFAFFSDSESNPHGYKVSKISDREYQVGTHSLYPILSNQNVMLNTPQGHLTLYEFYQKYLKDTSYAKSDKFISNQKEENEKNFIFSEQQFEFSNYVLDDSITHKSQAGKNLNFMNNSSSKLEFDDSNHSNLLNKLKAKNKELDSIDFEESDFLNDKDDLRDISPDDQFKSPDNSITKIR